MGQVSIVGADEQNICSLYTNGDSIQTISGKTGHSRTAVWNCLKRNNICDSHRTSRKYFCNNSYFSDINTEEKAYWLGFLMADGCVYRHANGKNLILSVQLQGLDFGHLVKLSKALDSTYPIKTYSRNGKLYCRIDIFSDTLCDNLISHGCTQRKTSTITMPSFDNSLLRHFVRGYFDGDGCIYHNKLLKKRWIDFTTASSEFINELSTMISLFCATSIRKADERDGAFHLRYYSKEDVMQVLHWMYGECGIYLNRKMAKYTDMDDKLDISIEEFIKLANHSKLTNF